MYRNHQFTILATVILTLSVFTMLATPATKTYAQAGGDVVSRAEATSPHLPAGLSFKVDGTNVPTTDCQWQTYTAVFAATVNGIHMDLEGPGRVYDCAVSNQYHVIYDLSGFGDNGVAYNLNGTVDVTTVVRGPYTYWTNNDHVTISEVHGPRFCTNIHDYEYVYKDGQFVRVKTRIVEECNIN